MAALSKWGEGLCRKSQFEYHEFGRTFAGGAQADRKLGLPYKCPQVMRDDEAEVKGAVSAASKQCAIGNSVPKIGAPAQPMKKSPCESKT